MHICDNDNHDHDNDGLAKLFLFKEILKTFVSVGSLANEVDRTNLMRQQQAKQHEEEEARKWWQAKKQEEEDRRKWREEYPCPHFLDKRDINVGVCGESGAGKSTFINTIFKKKFGQPETALVGVNECTLQPQPHLAQNGNLNTKTIFWDLPGAGTTKFPLQDYIQKFGIRHYNALAIIGDTRVREIDSNLVKECERTKVRHVYVRTKMDHAVRDNAEQRKGLVETFDEVRKGLREKGIKKPYLIGRQFAVELDPDAWENTDFKKLVKDLFEMIKDSAKENRK